MLVRTYLRTAHRLIVIGRERLPTTGSFVVVANHSSHLDALVLASQLSRSMRDHVFPIAAGDTFFKTPFSSAFAAAALNALPVWRRSAGRHALDELRQRLGDEECVFILFPEGTRSRDGSLGAFKAGVGGLLAASNVPVVPCHLDGTFEALPPDRRLPRPVKIRLRIGNALRFADVSNDRVGWETVAERLRNAVRELGAQR